MEESVPEVIDVLRATVAAGINPRRALQAAAEGAPPSLEAVLSQAIRAAELGAGAGRALATAAEAEHLGELVLAGEALDLAETTGAPPGPVLAGVAAAAAGRIRSRQAMLAATAQARLSARVVAAMAPAFLGVLALTLRRCIPDPRTARLGSSHNCGDLRVARRLVGHPHRSRLGPMTPRTPMAGRLLDPVSQQPRQLRRLRRWSTASPRLTPRRPAEERGAIGPVARIVAGIGVGLLGVALTADVPGFAVAVLLAVAGWPITAQAVRRRRVARRLAVRREAAPAVLDLLGAALRAGLNPHKAVLRVAERAPDVLKEDLSTAAAVLRLGGTPAEALRQAAHRSGLDEFRAAAAALETADRWGAPPAEALAARAEALRTRARLNAEAQAGRAAVRLAFPLVLCFLPAFILLTVVPTVAGALRALTP